MFSGMVDLTAYMLQRREAEGMRIEAESNQVT